MALCPPPASPQVHPRDCKHPRLHEGNEICPNDEVRKRTLNTDDDEAQRGSETVSEEKGRAGRLTSEARAAPGQAPRAPRDDSGPVRTRGHGPSPVAPAACSRTLKSSRRHSAWSAARRPVTWGWGYADPSSERVSSASQVVASDGAPNSHLSPWESSPTGPHSARSSRAR